MTKFSEKKKWVECPNSQSYRLMWLFKFSAHLNFSSAEKPKMLIRHSALHLPCIIRSMSRAAELVTNNKNDQYCCIIFPTKWRTQMLLFATLQLWKNAVVIVTFCFFCLQHHNENILKVEQGGKLQNSRRTIWKSSECHRETHIFKNCQENKNNKTFWLEAKTLLCSGFLALLKWIILHEWSHAI